MSGFYFGGFAPIGRQWWLATLTAAVLILSLFGWLFWTMKVTTDQAIDRAQTARVHAQFYTGEIVRSKVAKLRGVVLMVDCFGGCAYRVRFYQASMQPVWVQPFEIEAVD